MERIASFTINHLNLMPGLYVSRRDAKGDCVTTTFDLRITAPNREPVIDTPALHTIEHLAATYLRNCESKEDVIYFGPMIPAVSPAKFAGNRSGNDRTDL